MAHFAKYMMFKTLVASRRYASENSHNGIKTFLKLNWNLHKHYQGRNRLRNRIETASAFALTGTTVEGSC